MLREPNLNKEKNNSNIKLNTKNSLNNIDTEYDYEYDKIMIKSTSLS